MSVGFLFRGKINNDLLRIHSCKDVYEEIAGFIRVNCSLFPLKYPLFWIEDSKLYVKIYPGISVIHFSFNGHILVCDSRTSDVGPGYHAYSIDLIRKMGDTLNIDWDFSGDDSGYAITGCFDDIMDAMAEWLASVSKEILNKRQDKSYFGTIPINLVNGYIPVSDYYASCTIGYLEKEWFEDYLLYDLEEQKTCCHMFFPWWKKETDDEFYKNTAITMLWCDFKYHMPIDQKEHESYSLIAYCLQEAYIRKPSLDYPLAEWMYLYHSLANKKAAESFAEFLRNAGITSKPTIGFALSDVIMSVGMDFHILTQGNMYYQQMDETSVYWNNFINIKARTFKIGFKYYHDNDVFKKLEADKYIPFISLKSRRLRARILKKTAVIENITYDVIDFIAISDASGIILNIFCNGKEAFSWAEHSLKYVTLHKQIACI